MKLKKRILPIRSVASFCPSCSSNCGCGACHAGASMGSEGGNWEGASAAINVHVGNK